MSVCLNCLDSFVPGKSNRRGFCCLQCWRAYEHSTKSHNCMSPSRMNSSGKAKTKWLKKNLGDVINEVQGELDPKAVEPVVFNSHITTATHQLLEEVIQGYKKYRIENGLM